MGFIQCGRYARSDNTNLESTFLISYKLYKFLSGMKNINQIMQVNYFNRNINTGENYCYPIPMVRVLKIFLRYFGVF